MKYNKILTILAALAVVISIGVSVFAVAYVSSADDGNTVRLVSMDYIENSLLPAIEEKIAQNSVDNMQDTIAAINSTLDYLNSEVAASDSDILAIQSEISAIKGQLLAIENTISEGNNADVSALEAALSALQSRVEALEGNVSVLTQDIFELEKSVADITEQAVSLATSVENMQMYVDKHLDILYGRVVTSESNISALTENAQSMKTDIDTVKHEYQSLQTAYSALSERYTTLESEGSVTREDMAQMKLQLDNMNTVLESMSGDYGELVDAYNEYTKTIAALRSASDSGNASFSAIFLKEGEKLTCSGLPGDTMELIVRRGNVAVESPLPTQGLLDVTDSVELLDGKTVPEYHYILLAGGSDGRGIVSLSGDAWILVRGEYEIG